jgi:O-antigen ligase
MFKNPNDLALNLVTFLAPTLFVIIQEERTPRRLLAALIAVVMVIATTFTKSRSGFLGLVAMTGVVAYYAARIKPGFIMAVVVAGVLTLPTMPGSFWTRMDSIVNADVDATGSRAARIRLLNQGLEVFAANPLTGIGAGQFQNYNAPGIVEKWRVTHNVWLQVAAELGIFGLLTFAFLVARAYTSCFAALRMLKRPRRRRVFHQVGADAPLAGGEPSALEPARLPVSDEQLSEDDRRILEINAKSMIAGLVGWTVCAFFASVAFNWTFYYVLALAVAGREIVASRRRVPRREKNTMRAGGLVRAHA